MANKIRGRSSGVYFKGYIDGGPELERKLQSLTKAWSDVAIATATAAGAEVIADEWRRQVLSRIGRGPGTAHYADAIGYRASPGSEGATAYVGLPENVPVSANEAHPREYAPRLEFGGWKNGYRAAQPTLRPAFDSSRGRALDAMADRLRALLEKVA